MFLMTDILLLIRSESLKKNIWHCLHCQIFVPYHETVASPPLILSVVDNGMDYTAVLHNLIVIGV